MTASSGVGVRHRAAGVNVRTFASDENAFSDLYGAVIATYWEPIDLGESDCLIKQSKEIAYKRYILFVISAQCSDCQSGEIRTSAGQRRE